MTTTNTTDAGQDLTGHYKARAWVGEPVAPKRPAPMTVAEILESETLDPALVDAAERAVCRELGPLTRTTDRAGWDRYWQAVADKVNQYVADRAAFDQARDAARARDGIPGVSSR